MSRESLLYKGDAARACMAGLHQTVKKWLAEDVYDTRRFEEAYHFQTRTSLKDGLKREVDWYKKRSAEC